ncbi:hypothetical protein RI367_006554 [Sorochytrium milnesiophthora]
MTPLSLLQVLCLLAIVPWAAVAAPKPLPDEVRGPASPVTLSGGGGQAAAPVQQSLQTLSRTTKDGNNPLPVQVTTAVNPNSAGGGSNPIQPVPNSGSNTGSSEIPAKKEESAVTDKNNTKDTKIDPKGKKEDDKVTDSKAPDEVTSAQAALANPNVNPKATSVTVAGQTADSTKATASQTPNAIQWSTQTELSRVVGLPTRVVLTMNTTCEKGCKFSLSSDDVMLDVCNVTLNSTAKQVEFWAKVTKEVAPGSASAIIKINEMVLNGAEAIMPGAIEQTVNVSYVTVPSLEKERMCAVFGDPHISMFAMETQSLDLQASYLSKDNGTFWLIKSDLINVQAVFAPCYEQHAAANAQVTCVSQLTMMVSGQGFLIQSLGTSLNVSMMFTGGHYLSATILVNHKAINSNFNGLCGPYAAASGSDIESPGKKIKFERGWLKANNQLSPTDEVPASLFVQDWRADSSLFSIPAPKWPQSSCVLPTKYTPAYNKRPEADVKSELPIKVNTDPVVPSNTVDNVQAEVDISMFLAPGYMFAKADAVLPCGPIPDQNPAPLARPTVALPGPMSQGDKEHRDRICATMITEITNCSVSVDLHVRNCQGDMIAPLLPGDIANVHLGFYRGQCNLELQEKANSPDPQESKLALKAIDENVLGNTDNCGDFCAVGQCETNMGCRQCLNDTMTGTKCQTPKAMLKCNQTYALQHTDFVQIRIQSSYIESPASNTCTGENCAETPSHTQSQADTQAPPSDSAYAKQPQPKSSNKPKTKPHRDPAVPKKEYRTSPQRQASTKSHGTPKDNYMPSQSQSKPSGGTSIKPDIFRAPPSSYGSTGGSKCPTDGNSCLAAEAMHNKCIDMEVDGKAVKRCVVDIDVADKCAAV